ncbi:MAG: hypothetical protein HYT76_00415 [Deltaproteobacteria bacterium]|nr:hypothetical protein [Deltaproteobacteria bacterium]
MSLEAQPIVDQWITAWADARDSWLYYPRIESEGGPSWGRSFGDLHLVTPQNRFERTDRETVRRGLLGLRDSYEGLLVRLEAILRGLPREVPEKLKILREEAVTWRGFVTALREHSEGIHWQTVTWRDVLSVYKKATRFADPHIAAARMDLIHAAYARVPLGAVYYLEGVRNVLYLGGGGATDYLGVQLLYGYCAAAGDRFFHLFGASQGLPFSRYAEALELVRTKGLANPCYSQLQGYLDQALADHDIAGRLLWGNATDNGAKDIRNNAGLIRTAKKRARDAKDALLRQMGEFPALREHPPHLEVTLRPVLAVAGESSLGTHMARFAVASATPRTGSVVHGLVRSSLKKGGILAAGALVFLGLGGDSLFG